MAYNNFNQGYGPRVSNYQPGQRLSMGRGFAQTRTVKKHSGAKFHATSKNGNPCITAWNYSRRTGLVSIFIAPYKNTAPHTSKNGNEYENWMCTIEGKGIAPRHFPVLVSTRTRKTTIEEGFGWVVNPQAPNGGYCGTFKKK